MITEDMVKYNLDDIKFTKTLAKVNESPYELDDVVSILKVLPIEDLSIDNLRSSNAYMSPDLSNPFRTELLRDSTIDLGELPTMDSQDLGIDAVELEILDKDLSQEPYLAVMILTKVATENPSGGYQVVTRSAVILPTEDHKRSFEYIIKLHIDRLIKYIVSECRNNKKRFWDGLPLINV